jgi:ketosteroid isomerase-like protein
MSGNRMGHRVRMSRNARAAVACALALLLLQARGILTATAQDANPDQAAPAAPAAPDQANPLHTASRIELDIVKVVLAQEKAWNAGDIDGYAKGYKDSPDTLFIGKQISKGYSQMLEDYKRNYPTRQSMGTLSFSELEVHALSDTFAVCLGKYHLERSKKDGGAADGVFSLVFQKTDQGWKIVLDHTT